VGQSIADRKVTEIDSEQSVPVPVDGIGEPTFRKGNSGARELPLPGNKEFVKGDKVRRAEEEDGTGNGAGGMGDGSDDFTFTLTREEFLDFFFEDLELPDLVKRRLKDSETKVPGRAGYAVSGAAQALDVVRTMRNGIARRLALRRPTPDEVAALEERLKDAENSGDDVLASELAAKLKVLQRRMMAVPWIDPVDIRYRRYEGRPTPAAQAVMFCLMDVSGSMNEHMKDLAKRFFMLLYLFLQRRYKAVEVVFIRHTHEAQEVDEETFFRSRETGGTVVSSALDTAARIIADRFPLDSWNIYVAQASDGDNMTSDRARVVDAMNRQLLPASQYFAYLEVSDPPDDPAETNTTETELWHVYDRLRQPGAPLAMRRAAQAKDVFAVFHDLFAREKVLS